MSRRALIERDLRHLGTAAQREAAWARLSAWALVGEHLPAHAVELPCTLCGAAHDPAYNSARPPLCRECQHTLRYMMPCVTWLGSIRARLRQLGVLLADPTAKG